MNRLPSCLPHARHMLSAALLGACGLLAIGATQALAQPTPILASVDWRNLSADQQAALQPLAKRWSRMSPDTQRKWLAVSSNYKQLSPADQQRLHARMLDWASMSKAERMQARRNYGDARQTLSADERKAKWDEFRNLDEDEREALARKGSEATRVRSTAPAVQPQPMRVKLPEPKTPR